MHEVLPRGQPHDPEEEETVSVRVLGFLPPLLFRRPSRRSFDHATRYARVRRRDPRRFEKTPPRLSSYFRLETITRSREYVPVLYIRLPLRNSRLRVVRLCSSSYIDYWYVSRNVCFFFVPGNDGNGTRVGSFHSRSGAHSAFHSPLARVCSRLPPATRALPVRASVSAFASRARERDARHRLLVAEPQARQPPLALGPLAHRRRVRVSVVRANVACPRSSRARKPRTRSSAYASRRPRRDDARVRAENPRKYAWMVVAATDLTRASSRSLASSSSFRESAGEKNRRAASPSSFRFSRSLSSRRAARRAAADATAIAETPVRPLSVPSANRESNVASSSRWFESSSALRAYASSRRARSATSALLRATNRRHPETRATNASAPSGSWRLRKTF